jgi:hypothetical protein
MRKKIRDWFWLDYILLLPMFWFPFVFFPFAFIYIALGYNYRYLGFYELIFIPLYLFSIWWSCNYDRFFNK